MSVPLIVNTLIISLIFIISYFVIYQKYGNNNFKYILYGAFTWSLISLVILFPTLLLFNSSTELNYKRIFDVNDKDLRTLTFWLLLLISVITEVSRFLALGNKKLIGIRYSDRIYFGLGWGIAEFLTRFDFFFKNYNSKNLLYELLILILIIALNASLSLVLIRVDENTKFVMFAVFMKFFFEISIFGSFGYLSNYTEIFLDLYFIIFITVILVLLSLKTRKQPLQN